MKESTLKTLIFIIFSLLIIGVSLLMDMKSEERELYDTIYNDIYDRCNGYMWDRLGGDFRIESFDDAYIEKKDGFYEVFIEYGLWVSDPFYEGWDSDLYGIYHCKAKKINGEWEIKTFDDDIDDYDSLEDWERARDRFFSSWD